MTFSFSPENKILAEALIREYPDPSTAVLPLLQLVMRQEGAVPSSAFSVIAALASCPPVQVEEAASFYPILSVHREEG